MKILQIAPAYYPALSIGGPILSTLALNKLLTINNHQVTTLTTPLGLCDADARKITYGTPVDSPCGSSLIYQPYSGYAHFTWSPASLRWLKKHAKEFDLVIVQGVWNFPLMAAAWVCQRDGIPYALFPHGTLYRETVNLRSGIKKRFMLLLFVRRMLKRAARVVFTTTDEAQKVQAFLGLQLRVAMVPNIVDPAEFEFLPKRGALRQLLGIPADTAILLHLGRITRKKALHTTLDVLARLHAKGKKVSLLIVGGDEAGQQAELEQQAQHLGISAAVHFTGLLDRLQITQALADSDVFMLPSLSENFGIAVVEAMMARLPVVISDHVGLAPDIAAAGSGVVVLLSEGAPAFADAVSKLLDSDEYRKVLGEAGRQFAIDNYSNAAVSDKIELLLNDIQQEIRHVPR
jgi:glycosyltransferase involved in cell wall biosynthesis